MAAGGFVDAAAVTLVVEETAAAGFRQSWSSFEVSRASEAFLRFRWRLEEAAVSLLDEAEEEDEAVEERRRDAPAGAEAVAVDDEALALPRDEALVLRLLTAVDRAILFVVIKWWVMTGLRYGILARRVSRYLPLEGV